VAVTVQQLAVHAASGVVTPAQALLVVVPDEAEDLTDIQAHRVRLADELLNRCQHESGAASINPSRTQTMAATQERAALAAQIYVAARQNHQHHETTQ
jgi:hypothetical protein